MKKLLIVCMGLLSTLGFAQKKDTGLLWKISGNGLTKPSYLYGTMHITCDATLDKNIHAALDATGQMYLEMDMDDPNMQAQMMATMMMKDGNTMSKLATPEDLKIVSDFLTTNLGMPAALVNNIKPALISMMLYPKMIDCPMQSYEQELMAVAKEQKEEVYGLETMADQMAVFDAIPYKDQMDELVKTAKDNMVQDKANTKKMMDVYNTKDLEAIMAMMKEEDNKLYGDNTDILLKNRNTNWITKIEKAAKEKPTFFGVGAAHLGGDDGVIKLLRKKGYTVEAVK